jgi:hypothetical protein
MGENTLEGLVEELICQACQETYDDCECPESEVRDEAMRERFRKFQQDEQDEIARMVAAFDEEKKP